MITLPYSKNTEDLFKSLLNTIHTAAAARNNYIFNLFPWSFELMLLADSLEEEGNEAAAHIYRELASDRIYVQWHYNPHSPNYSKIATKYQFKEKPQTYYELDNSGVFEESVYLENRLKKFAHESETDNSKCLWNLIMGHYYFAVAIEVPPNLLDWFDNFEQRNILQNNFQLAWGWTTSYIPRGVEILLRAAIGMRPKGKDSAIVRTHTL